MLISTRHRRLETAALVAIVLGSATAAQRPARVPEVAPTTHQVRWDTADLPSPPRSVLNEIGIGGLPRVPVVESDLPQPQDPAVDAVDPAKQQSLTGQFRVWRNRDQRPSGGRLGSPGEPSTIANGDTWFATGNTYGSLSTDSGQTWRHVNPYTLFPAVDGGVCCDQRVLYIPNLDLTIWFIQYRRSATTRTGGFRIAVARSQADLRAGRWVSYYWNTRDFTNLANRGLDQWFDYPDISASRDYLYVSSNVFNFSNGYTNSAILRMRLAGLDGSGSVGMVYYLRSGGPGAIGGGPSYRLTQTFCGNRPITMLWASHNNTGSLRVCRWDDANSARFVDVNRGVPSWTDGAGTSRGPDGRDWLGFDDHRIASGYYKNPAECGFLWTSRNRSNRPQNFIRVCRINPANRNVIGNNDLWSADLDFAYPAVSVNSLGHQGAVFSAGGSGLHVTTYARLIDQYQTSWGGGSIYRLANGTHGAPTNRWGDYHTVMVNNRVNNRTFIGTAMHQSGSTSAGNTVHRAVWFGRDDYPVAQVALNIRSAPITGIPITVETTDILGRTNGNTNLTRTYMQGQGYRVTAPATRALGTDVYVFSSWTGTVSSSSRTLSVSNIGSVADTVTANYTRTRRHTILSNVRPSITSTVQDVVGNRNGTAPFARYYLPFGTSTVTYTAAATALGPRGTLSFYRWEVNGTPRAIGERRLDIVRNASLTLRAVYGRNLPGSVTRFGASCRGSAGIPNHTVTGTPAPGARMTYSVSNLPSGAPTFLALGASNTAWNSISLPLDLAVLGASGCRAYISQDSILSMVNTSGFALRIFALPNDSAVIGQSFYSQVLCSDPGANNLGFTLSNYYRTSIGGWQIP